MRKSCREHIQNTTQTRNCTNSVVALQDRCSYTEPTTDDHIKKNSLFARVCRLVKMEPKPVDHVTCCILRGVAFQYISTGANPYAICKMEVWPINILTALRLFRLCAVPLSPRPVIFKPVGRDHGMCRKLFLDGSLVDILCTQLYYICFIRVSDGGRWVIVGYCNGRGARKVENNCARQFLPIFDSLMSLIIHQWDPVMS